MRPIDANRLHERRDVLSEQLRRVGAGRLIRLARTAWINRYAGEMLGILRDLKGVAGIVRRQIRNEDEWLSRALLVIIHGHVVDLDLRHLFASLVARLYRGSFQPSGEYPIKNIKCRGR